MNAVYLEALSQVRDQDLLLRDQEAQNEWLVVEHIALLGVEALNWHCG